MTSTLGQIVDGLGVDPTLAADDMVTDVIVVAKVVDSTGRSRVSCAWSQGQDWITRYGMLRIATEMEQASGRHDNCDHDEES